MNIYAVYMHDHTGDNDIKVFTSDEERCEFINQDAAHVMAILIEDGYKCEKITGCDICGVYVPEVSDIYYEWICCDTELKGV